MEKTKNTFQDGLIMDFSPDNTGATSLTSALNATILTFNGNEMALQNDMGNGRVETAYLPEGYIPVGTCEFGDIIYIASYNPLTNRAQIGCFPSPERNISSEELGGCGQSLDYTDFQIQELDQAGNKLDRPSGELKSTSVRKVLIDNRNTNPGDKYVIFSEQASANFEKFGELENSKKYLKLSVVSIDDSGKITYLDTDTHYYQYDGNNVVYDHFISPKMIQHGTDIDEYRNMLQSGWNIFSSKNPGKLAILAELNTIDTFSCTYSVIVDEIAPTDSNEGSVKYTVYFTPIFKSNDGQKVYLSRENIRGAELVSQSSTDYEFRIRKNQFSSVGENDEPLYRIRLNKVSDSDRIPNYHNVEEFDNFAGPILEERQIEPIISEHNYLAFEVEIPYQYNELIKSEQLIYSCDIIPAMPFGKLDYLKVPITIDFNKIGSGEIGLTKWRYYNYGTQCTLQYGLEIYNKPNEETKRVIIDFYDNTGHAARYTLENQDSFSGVHTEHLGLDGENYNYRLNKVLEGKEYILHKAQEYRDFDINTDTITYWEGGEQKYIGKDPNGDIKSTDLSNLGPGLYQLSMVDNTLIDGSYLVEKKDDSLKIYTNDAGVLYSNILYAALITVESSSNSSIEQKHYWRWLWTNNMYNEYYYQVDDFDILKFQLDLDINAIFEASDSYQWQETTINNLDNNIDDGCYKSYSSNVQYIGHNKDGNVNLYTSPGLQNDYGCFNLLSIDNNDKEDVLKNFNLEIYLGKSKISYSDYADNYEYSMQQILLSSADKKYLSLSEIINTTNQGDENGKYINKEELINVENITLNDTFNVCFASAGYTTEKMEDEDGEVNYHVVKCSLKDCYYESLSNKKAIKLNLAASIFTKAYTCSSQKYTGDLPTYSPLISNMEELNNYGIELTQKNNQAFLRMNSAFMGMIGGSDFEYSFGPLQSNNSIFDRASKEDDTDSKKGDRNSYNSYGTNTYTQLYNQQAESYLNQFFIFYPGGDNSYSFTSIRGNSGFEEVRRGLNNATPKWDINRKKYCIQFINNAGTERLPDIYDDKGVIKLRWIGPHSGVGILCMKHPSGGFIAFNTIYLDYDSTYEGNNGTFLPQRERQKSNVHYTQYPNFSIPLYLILSRIYTKEKTVPTTSDAIRLLNYVRRAQYSTTLTKDVIIKISQDKDKTQNIAMSGIDFNDYKSNLLNVIQNLPDSSNVNKNALELSFSDCAKNTVLTIKVQNKQMEFPEIEDKALLMINGVAVPCEKITDNQFYIYYDGHLIPYTDQEFKFDRNQILNNLNYLLETDSILGIDYITGAEVKLPVTEDEQATDALAVAMDWFYNDGDIQDLFVDALEDRKTYDDLEAKDIIMTLLEQCFTLGEDQFMFGTKTYYVPSKYYQQWQSEFPFSDVWQLMRSVKNSYGNTLYQSIFDSIQFDHHGYLAFGALYINFTHVDRFIEDAITITPQLNLSENFEYTSKGIQLKEYAPHNMLKICQGDGGEDIGNRINGLQCIMKDVSIDITHRITEN